MLSKCCKKFRNFWRQIPFLLSFVYNGRKCCNRKIFFKFQFSTDLHFLGLKNAEKNTFTKCLCLCVSSLYRRKVYEVTHITEPNFIHRFWLWPANHSSIQVYSAVSGTVTKIFVRISLLHHLNIHEIINIIEPNFIYILIQLQAYTRCL